MNRVMLMGEIERLRREYVKMSKEASKLSKSMEEELDLLDLGLEDLYWTLSKIEDAIEVCKRYGWGVPPEFEEVKKDIEQMIHELKVEIEEVRGSMLSLVEAKMSVALAKMVCLKHKSAFEKVKNMKGFAKIMTYFEEREKIGGYF